MNELSLFTGAGGGLLGTKLLGFTHVGYVEYNEYCQRVIAQRIDDGLLDTAPIFGDISAFIDNGYAASYSGLVDVVTAGFPCQPFSVAGKGLGEDDPRNKWPETLECLRLVRPRFALLENVPGLFAHEYTRIIFWQLAEAGFDARWCVLGADDCGAPHRRKRVWILATNTDNDRQRCEIQPQCEQRSATSTDVGCDGKARPMANAGQRRRGESCEREVQQPRRAETVGASSAMADTAGERCGEAGADIERSAEWVAGGGDALADAAGQCEREPANKTHAEPVGGEAWAEPWGCGEYVSDACVERPQRCADIEAGTEAGPGIDPGCETVGAHHENGWCGSPWPAEPDVGRVAHGVAHRVDRLKALGNGQVSRVVAAAWEMLTTEEEQ